MKKHYSILRLASFIKRRSRKAGALSLLLASVLPATLLAQQSYTFTNCGATGATGPTQLQASTAYGSNNLNGLVVVAGGIQSFTVPLTGLYQINMYGAAAGNPTNYPTKFGGYGSRVQGEFNFTQGTVLQILVGQKGADGCGTSGGGGGSYVTSNNVLIIAAGAGGGGTSDQNGANSTTLTSGTNDNPGGSIPGGTNGSGGSACNVGSPGANHGGAGAGYSGNGATSSAPTPGGGGFSFTNGGTGGSGNAVGGFGGGGGGTSCTVGGGGGGGYSGGAGGQQVNYCTAGLQRTGGGGGGCYNTGTNTLSVAGISTGHGTVIITALCNINLSSSSASGPGPICSGQSVTLTTNAISNYSWSTGATTSSLVLSPTVTTIYTLTATSPSNCTASSIITVTVDNTPTVTAVSSASAVCAGKPLTLTASGVTTYTWTGGVTNGVAFAPASTSGYTVTGTNACGTASAAIAAVTVNTLPNISGAANNPTVCNGSSVILNGSGSVSGYTWTGGVTNNSSFVPSVTNDYTVTGASAQNCTNTAVVTVSVFVTPSVTPVASPTAICVGKTSTLISVGATTGYTWSTSPAAYTSTVAVSPTSTTIYTVTRASSACVSIMTVQVVVNPLPTIFMGTPSSTAVCAGLCSSLSVVGAITYTWYPGGFQGSNIMVCPNNPTTYTVVASNANCTISGTSQVSVQPSPTITILPSATVVCAGSALSMTAGGALSYTWQTPNVNAGQQNQSTVTLNPLVPTLYYVSGTNAFGCIASQNQVVLVNAAPNLTTSIVNTGSFICAGGIGTLTALGTGPTNYNWTTGSTANTTTVNPTTSTVYTVIGTNTTTGCQSVATLSLAVYISTFVVSSPTAVCKGTTVTITAAGAANNYTWSGGSPNNTPSITVSPAASTTYYVSGFTGNCSTTQSVMLTVNQIPNVTASVAKLTICKFEPGILTGAGATSYSWAASSGPGSSLSTFTVFPGVTTTYTLTGTDNNNCSKTVNITQFVSTCIGIEEQNNLASQLDIFPNPSNGEFTIEAGTAMSISIINELGQVINTFNLSEKEKQVKVSGLASGIYFILAEKDGNISTKKVIVAK